MKKMDFRQFALWTAALAVGAVLGSLGVADEEPVLPKLIAGSVR